MIAEKAPPKRKFPKIRDLKKILTISGVIIAFAVTGLVGGIIIINLLEEDELGDTFIYCVDSCPAYIDPLQMRQGEDIRIVEQVAEGLFDYNCTSESYKPILNLATESEWSIDVLNLTCTLRQGVKFHDGTPFNATAVKWNFDRIYRLVNDTDFAYSHLWLFPGGEFIINQTQVLDEYTIRFVLNAPYVPLKGLLASWTSYILSPTSTPEDEFIDLLTGNLVGTGPFIYDSYQYLINVTFYANPNYWGGKPKIHKLVFLEWQKDFATVEESLKSGEISMLESDILLNYHKDPEVLLNRFKNNPNVTVLEGPLLPTLGLLILNNRLINTTMRKAISYAINDTAFLDIFIPVSARSPIPKSMPYSNWEDFNVPYYNVSIARQTLKDAGWSGTENLTANSDISAGNEWELLANSSNPLATFNHTYTDSRMQAFFANLIPENLKQIGVKVEPVNISSFVAYLILYEIGGYHRNMLELVFIAWEADFNDPSNLINPMFSNIKPNDNYGQVNDTLVQQWLEEGLGETNETARETIYYNIQKRLIEEVYPCAWLTSKRKIDIFVSNLRGWCPNPFKESFKTVYFVKRDSQVREVQVLRWNTFNVDYMSPAYIKS